MHGSISCADPEILQRGVHLQTRDRVGPASDQRGSNKFYQMLLKHIFFENRGDGFWTPCPSSGLEHAYPEGIGVIRPLDFSGHQRKSVFGVSDQVRHKPGCTVKEAGQRLEILDLERKEIV